MIELQAVHFLAAKNYKEGKKMGLDMYLYAVPKINRMNFMEVFNCRIESDPTERARPGILSKAEASYCKM
jgi:hypothetical protein